LVLFFVLLLITIMLLLSSCGDLTGTDSPTPIATPTTLPLARVSQTSSPAPEVHPQPVPRFEHLSVEDGLAHREVNAIIQDEMGFMWFARAGVTC
jgi:hypothetical protein